MSVVAEAVAARRSRRGLGQRVPADVEGELAPGRSGRRRPMVPTSRPRSRSRSRPRPGRAAAGQRGGDHHLARARQRGHAGRRHAAGPSASHSRPRIALVAELHVGVTRSERAAVSEPTSRAESWSRRARRAVARGLHRVGMRTAASSSATPRPTPTAVSSGAGSRSARRPAPCGPEPQFAQPGPARRRAARPADSAVRVRPSRTTTSRSEYAATRGSWVTSTTAAPVSRAAVGRAAASPARR